MRTIFNHPYLVLAIAVLLLPLIIVAPLTLPIGLDLGHTFLMLILVIALGEMRKRKDVETTQTNLLLRALVLFNDMPNTQARDHSDNTYVLAADISRLLKK